MRMNTGIPSQYSIRVKAPVTSYKSHILNTTFEVIKIEKKRSTGTRMAVVHSDVSLYQT